MKMLEDWTEKEVRPYLQHLLNEAQKRTTKKICYRQNQFCDHLWLGKKDLLYNLASIPTEFSELQQFVEMLKELSLEWQNPWVGDIKPITAYSGERKETPMALTHRRIRKKL